MKFSYLMFFTILALAALPMILEAQTKPAASEITGLWQGALDAGGVKLRLVVEIASKDGKTYTGTLKSIDQTPNPIPISKITHTDSVVRVEVAAIGGAFEGKLSKDGKSIVGNWTQGPAALPLTLARIDKAPEVRRPQEPKPPFPYIAEEVSYDSLQPNVKLAATLTLPKGTGPFPAVVMITGSGPQDRNEELFQHKPFLVIADWLTRHGIAVLRADDRGVGKSTGNFAAATSADFAEDVKGGIAFLKTRKEIDSAKIGLIGHSEGGLIAPMVAAESKDVAFIVMLAGTGVPGTEILMEQSSLIEKANGAKQQEMDFNRAMMQKVYAILDAEKDSAEAEKKLNATIREEVAKLPEEQRKALPEAAMKQQVKTMTSPWMRYFLTYDPRTSLQKVTIPVLVLNGEKDLQVPPKQNLPEIKKALEAAGNKRFTIKEFPNLNHLFQTSKTGSPQEYGEIEETIAPPVLTAISEWITSTIH